MSWHGLPESGGITVLQVPLQPYHREASIDWSAEESLKAGTARSQEAVSGKEPAVAVRHPIADFGVLEPDGEVLIKKDTFFMGRRKSQPSTLS